MGLLLKFKSEFSKIMNFAQIVSAALATTETNVGTLAHLFHDTFCLSSIVC